MYAEDNGSFSKCERRIRIGLPKGNIYGKSKELVSLITGEAVPKGVLSICFENYVFYFLKHRDIPGLVEKGKLDYGITSDEWIEETGADLIRLKELEWCDTQIALLVNKNNSGEIKNCVSEYINIARKYWCNEEMEVEYVSGSCEALVPTLFDCCVGCVESGGTLKQNNLMIKEILLTSKVVLVGKRESLNDELEKVYKCIEEMKR